jgi:hypothetical protein
MSDIESDSEPSTVRVIAEIGGTLEMGSASEMDSPSRSSEYRSNESVVVPDGFASSSAGAA